MDLSTLQLAILMAASAAALVALSLVFLQRAHIQPLLTRIWALAYVCLAVRHLSALQGGTAQAWAQLLSDLALAGYVSLFWCGARLFCNRTLHPLRMMLLFAAAALWLLSAYAVQLELFWRVLPVHLLYGGMLLATAAGFWQSRHISRSGCCVLLAILVGLRGLHVLDYPFLRTVMAFAPWGFALGFVLDVSIALGLLAAILLHQQAHLEGLMQARDDEARAREQAEHQRREREALFEKVFQLVPDVLVICREADGRYVDVNRNWERVTGFSRAESLGKTARDLNSWPDWAARDALHAVLQHDRQVKDYPAELRHKKGHTYHVNISGVCFDSEGVGYVLYVVQDVSELRERDQRFAKMFDLVPDAISISRVEDGQMLDVNQRWQEMFGLNKLQAQGKRSVEDLHLWSNHERRAQLLESLRAGGNISAMELSFENRAGHYIHAEGAFTLFSSNGEELLFSAFRDVSELHRAERARQQAEACLRKSERQLRTVLSAMGEGVVVWASERRVVLHNLKRAAILERPFAR